jgi:hypothetical protein
MFLGALLFNFRSRDWPPFYSFSLQDLRNVTNLRLKYHLVTESLSKSTRRNLVKKILLSPNALAFDHSKNNLWGRPYARHFPIWSSPFFTKAVNNSPRLCDSQPNLIHPGQYKRWRRMRRNQVGGITTRKSRLWSWWDSLCAEDRRQRREAHRLTKEQLKETD